MFVSVSIIFLYFIFSAYIGVLREAVNIQSHSDISSGLYTSTWFSTVFTDSAYSLYSSWQHIYNGYIHNLLFKILLLRHFNIIICLTNFLPEFFHLPIVSTHPILLYLPPWQYLVIISIYELLIGLFSTVHITIRRSTIWDVVCVVK